MSGNYIIRIAVLFLSITLLSACNTDRQNNEIVDKSVDIEPILLNADLIPIDYERIALTRDHWLEIHSAHDGKIYCSVIDNDFMHGVFMRTSNIVIYDIASKTTEVIDYPKDERIIDFEVLGNDIYYVTVTAYDEISGPDEMIKWTLKRSDLRFSSETALLSGELSNPTTTPELIMDEGKCYIVWTDTSKGSIESGISIIGTDACIPVFVAKSEEEHIIDLYRTRIDDDALIFKVRKEDCDAIKSVNIQNKEEKYLFSIPHNSSEGYLFGIEQTDDFLYFSTKNELSCNVYLVGKEKTVRYLMEDTLTSETALANDKVIASKTGTYYIFSKDGLQKLIIADVPNINHHFYVIDQNRIVIQDFDGKLYILNF